MTSHLPTQRPPRRFAVLGGLCLLAALSLFAAARSFTSYASVKPLLDQVRGQLPPELRNVDGTKWRAWAERRDRAIRNRLRQGDLDSMVNLVLLGTSFTTQPRILMEHLTEASKAGILRARVDDLVAGLRAPGGNERLAFLQRLVGSEGIDLETPDGSRAAGKFIYDNLLRVLRERKELAARAKSETIAPLPSDPASLLDRSSIFDDRGLSLDTGIIPEFTIEQTLRDLKRRGMLREGQVSRVAVIGPGLDFIDKNEDSAFDYYPEQTIQPFALYDSLARLKLAGTGLSVSVLDISPRVLDHLRRARDRARKRIGYDIQLPRDVARPWPQQLIDYWQSFGDQAGAAITPLRPPALFQRLETRAVRIRPEAVLACEPVDLNIVLERLNTADRFDLVIATNIFVYYDRFEQTLALANIAAMLKPGGYLLTNDRLPDLPDGSARLAGVTVVPFDAPGIAARQAVGWYRRQ